MVAKVFVLVCAAFVCVSGSCVEVKKPCTSQFLTFESSPVSQLVSNDNGFSGQELLKTVQMVKENSVRDGWSKNRVFVNLESNNNGENGNGNQNANVLFGNGFDGNFDGPETAPLPVLLAPAVTLPTVEAPMVTLSSPAVPAPRVLASRCVCTKTVVKPQVYQRVVTVPKVQRYLKRTVTPVVENLVYKSRPLTAANGNGNVLSGSSAVVTRSAVVGNNQLVGNSFLQGNVFGGQTTLQSSAPVVVSGSYNTCKY